MKIIFVLALCAVGINALPNTVHNTRIDLRNDRLVTDAIASAIEDLSQSIKDAGLDPLIIESESYEYALPVASLLSVEGLVEELDFNGLSNIVITNLNFNIITTRLTIDVNLPLIQLTLKKAQIEIDTFGEQFSASLSGSLAIRGVRLNGNVRVNVGIISGISIREINLFFNLGGIDSALNVGVQDWNLSSRVNNFLGTTIPSKLREFSADINKLLEIVVKDIAESILSNTL